jgi:hypothetical protein
MKKLIFALSAAFALTACDLAPPNPIPTPASFAQRTAADEQVAVGIELGYKAFRMAAELGVDSGAIKGARAAQIAAVDKRAYAAVLTARKAYQTANAGDYITAARQANETIAAAVATVGSR